MTPQTATTTSVSLSELLDFVRPRVRQGNSVLRITPRRWGPVATGGFPPGLAS